MCLLLNIGTSSSTSTSDDAEATTFTSISSSPIQGSSVEKCQCQCCSDPSTPHHPSDLTDSGVTHVHRNKGSGLKCYSRHIQPSWYKSFPWISVCSTTLKMYCSICRSAKSRGLLTFPKHYKSAFVDDGFRNLKKALERFRDHEGSVMHKESVLKLAATKSAAMGVDAQLSSQLESDQSHHRRMLMKLLSCIKYLVRQGLPLRGHNEDSESFEGNLYQLLLLQAQDCPDMTMWLRNKEYISPEIVNELIKMMGQSVLSNSLVRFLILADEATDISS